MKVFISYNHKDQETAFKIAKTLAAGGFEPIIDAEQMKSGQDIKTFILDCIRESGVTLSLVSVNSLMSAWVTMETMMTGADANLRGRQFIPAYIDGAFFERSFTGKALDNVDAQLEEINGLMIDALQKGRGIEDLQAERTRYQQMKANLPEIIGKLRDTLCIDLTPEHYEANMQKIMADLKAGEAVAAQ